MGNMYNKIDKFRTDNFGDGDPSFSPILEFCVTILFLSAFILPMALVKLAYFYQILLFNLWEILQ